VVVVVVVFVFVVVVVAVVVVTDETSEHFGWCWVYNMNCHAWVFLIPSIGSV
jgi:hypothetical protein